MDAIDQVTDHMRAALARLQGPGGELLRAMLAHHLGWDESGGKHSAGKLVRPRLCLLACEAVCGDPLPAVSAAAAVELIHNFSLIHDDIEDRDEVRRGRPTVWKRFGEAQAINAGDGMYSLAYAALVDGGQALPPDQDPQAESLSSMDAAAPRRLRAVGMLSEACIHLCEGQSADLALHDRDDVTEAQYFAMIGGKTASLLACATGVGALLGGGDDAAVQAFREFGYELGVAFQVRDDVLGIWGEAEKTGKPVGGDLSRRRCSYPAIWALERAGAEDRSAVLAARGESQPARIAAAVAALERLGARAHAESVAAAAHDRAWAALEGLSLNPAALRQLHRVADFLIARDK